MSIGSSTHTRFFDYAGSFARSDTGPDTSADADSYAGSFRFNSKSRPDPLFDYGNFDHSDFDYGNMLHVDHVRLVRRLSL